MVQCLVSIFPTFFPPQSCLCSNKKQTFGIMPEICERMRWRTVFRVRSGFESGKENIVNHYYKDSDTYLLIDSVSVLTSKRITDECSKFTSPFHVLPRAWRDSEWNEDTHVVASSVNFHKMLQKWRASKCGRRTAGSLLSTLWRWDGMSWWEVWAPISRWGRPSKFFDFGENMMCRVSSTISIRCTTSSITSSTKRI